MFWCPRQGGGTRVCWTWNLSLHSAFASFIHSFIYLTSVSLSIYCVPSTGGGRGWDSAPPRQTLAGRDEGCIDWRMVVGGVRGLGWGMGGMRRGGGGGAGGAGRDRGAGGGMPDQVPKFERLREELGKIRDKGKRR